MQDIFVEIMLIAAFAIGVGTISSMVGIGGGIINTPLLIIIFGLTAQTAPATALVAALFVAVASTVAYYRQNPRPIMFKPGLFLAVMTVPGSLVGVALREYIVDDYVLLPSLEDEGSLAPENTSQFLMDIREQEGEYQSLWDKETQEAMENFQIEENGTNVDLEVALNGLRPR